MMQKPSSLAQEFLVHIPKCILKYHLCKVYTYVPAYAFNYVCM